MSLSSSTSATSPLSPEQQRIVALEASVAALTAAMQQQQSGQPPVPVPAAPARTPNPPAIRRPGSYDGLSPTQLESWLREIEQQLQWYVASINTAAQQVLFAASHLTGSALDWWTTLSQSQRAALIDFASFAAALRQRFQPVGAAYAARTALDTLAQSSRQSVQDYIAEFRRLITFLPTMAEEDRIHRFTRGLRAAVADKVVMEAPATLDLAFALASRIDNRGTLMRTGGAGHTPFASPVGGAPMDVSNVNDSDDDEDRSHSHTALTSSRRVQSATAPDVTAMLRAMQESTARTEERLNALLSSRGGRGGRGGSNGGSFNNRQGRPRSDRVTDVSPEEIRARLQRNACIRCGESGHFKNECPRLQGNKSTGGQQREGGQGKY